MLPDRPLLLGISETATPSVTKTSHTCGPLPLVMLLIFFEPFQITILDLEPNPDFQIFLYISETYYSTFNFNTSTRRSQLGQHFISFELSSCKLMRMLWLKNLIFHSFWLITFFFAVKPELCSHHTVGILQCYVSCSDC